MKFAVPEFCVTEFCSIHTKFIHAKFIQANFLRRNGADPLKDEIIGRIIALEEHVREVMSEAREKQRTLPERVHEKQSKIEKHLKQEYDSSLKKSAEALTRECDEQIAEVVKSKERRLREMDDEFARGRAAWADEIFRKILDWEE
ncbi:MAG: hypothetical protein LBK41_00290 [Clostridiales bacterium]|nr:hypothetical protein [Clostridiales bacterium]